MASVKVVKQVKAAPQIVQNQIPVVTQMVEILSLFSVQLPDI